jgi:hypothetical protein
MSCRTRAKIEPDVRELSIKSQAAIEDLYHVPENGKAEIVNGELRLMSPIGELPGGAAFRIAVSFGHPVATHRVMPDVRG